MDCHQLGYSGEMYRDELVTVQTAGSSTAVEPTTSKSSKHTVEGGVTVEDVKDGHGPEAKSGKLVS